MEVAGSMMNFCKSFSYVLFEVFFLLLLFFLIAIVYFSCYKLFDFHFIYI